MPSSTARATRAEFPEQLEAKSREHTHLGLTSLQRFLVESHMLLVRKMANKMALITKEGEAEDLFQAGCLGLEEASLRFESRFGVMFATYAAYWVRKRMVDHIQANLSLIRMPDKKARLTSKLRAVKVRVSQEVGRTPTFDELVEGFVEESGDPVGKAQIMVRDALMVEPSVVSLDTRVRDDDEATLGQFIEDKGSQDVFMSLEDVLRSDALQDALKTLTERDVQVLELRYGLGVGYSLTLEEVGERLGLSPNTVQRTEMNALRKLRHPTRSKKLRDLV